MYKERIIELKKESESEYLIREISQHNQLKLSEAQELYQKALEISDKTARKLYMDKVILGTLYVVHDYITRNNLSILSSKAYDINDITSSFTEIWIKKIYDGVLLKVDQFSSIFSPTYFKEVYQTLVGKDVIIQETFDTSTDIFTRLFYIFIQYKNNGLAFSYNDLIKAVSKDKYHYRYLIEQIDSSIMIIFEKIYNNLVCHNDTELDIGITKINNYLKILIDIGITDSISNDLIDSNNMETNTINKLLFTTFIKDIDEALANERARQIIHQRYGLDDGIPKTLEEIAQIHNLSRERVRQIEAKCLRILRRPTRNLKKYI